MIFMLKVRATLGLAPDIGIGYNENPLKIAKI